MSTYFYILNIIFPALAPLVQRLLSFLSCVQERCVDNCASKLIRSNHRLMGSYVQLMPQMVQRRMEEMESKAAENAKAAEAAAAAASSEASPALTSSQPPQAPLSLTEDAPEVHSSPLTSAGLDIPVDTAAAGVSLSLTPQTESANASVASEAGVAQPPLPEAPVDSGSRKLTSLSENVSTAALPPQAGQ